MDTRTDMTKQTHLQINGVTTAAETESLSQAP